MISFAAKVRRRIRAEIREYHRWYRLKQPNDLRVFYGFEQLPSLDEPVSGGIVKCMDLAETFPNHTEKANILYLVSSVLPDRRELLTRAAHRAGGRVVLNQNGVAYPAWAGKDWRKRNAPNAKVYAAADYVFYQSEFCRRCAERFLGIRSKPGEVLYNPVNTNRFSPKDRPPSSNGPCVLLVAGSHHDKNRLKTAVEILPLLQKKGLQVELQIAGRLMWAADADRQAHQWVKDVGVEHLVNFYGPYTQIEAPNIFRQADVLLHLKVQDPCPRLVVEAMACGLPVVYPTCGGTQELVGEDAGVSVPTRENFEIYELPEASAVADAVAAVLSKHAIYAQQARERAVRLFSLGPWMQRHAEIFERLAAL